MTEIAGVHPYAEKFPMLSDAELDELADSIATVGLLHPIVVNSDGLVLDGRNRLEACNRAQVEARTEVYDGVDIAEFVIASNVTRRNMSTGARAMATALVLEADGRRENGRWRRGSVLGEDAITETRNTWKDLLRQSGIVLDFKPDLAAEVTSGAVTHRMEEVMTPEEWMLAEYDRVVGRAGDDGLTLKESQTCLAEAYQSAVMAGEVDRPEDDLYAEGVGIFDRVVRPARQQRKNSLLKDMEYIAASLNDETVLGTHDPAFGLAYPLGTKDGRDKVLALWTREDWRNASMTRYRNAAETTAAAQIFEEQATIISNRMLAAGVDTTGELFQQDDAA